MVNLNKRDVSPDPPVKQSDLARLEGILGGLKMPDMSPIERAVADQAAEIQALRSEVAELRSRKPEKRASPVYTFDFEHGDDGIIKGARARPVS